MSCRRRPLGSIAGFAIGRLAIAGLAIAVMTFVIAASARDAAGAAAGEPAASGSAADRGADSIAIHSVVADLDSAWARGDADRWASHYTPDSEFINILGMLFPNPAAMRDRHHEIFTGVFRGTRHVGSLRRVRFLAPDVAIADVDVSVTGFKTLPPWARETRPGVLATRMRHIFQRVGGAWRIAATQNTAIVPVPVPAPR